MNVPTNAELEANAPDTVWEAVRNWLERHPTPREATMIGPAYRAARKEWLDWAATNLINDPEIRGAAIKERNAGQGISLHCLDENA